MRLPDTRVPHRLRQPAPRQVLYVESVNVDPADCPIGFARGWFVGDLVQLVIEPSR